MTTKNFSSIRGDTWPASTLTFDVEIDGVAEDLTDYTIKMQMRTKPGGTLIHDFSDEIEIIEAGAKFRINPAVLDYAGRVYYYDIEFTKAGVVKTWVTGEFEIIEDTTKLT